MYDPLKKDIIITISRLEMVHGELRSRYERAKADYDELHKQYMAAVDELTRAENDYVLIKRALKAMDDIRNEKSIDADDEDYF